MNPLKNPAQHYSKAGTQRSSLQAQKCKAGVNRSSDPINAHETLGARPFNGMSTLELQVSAI